MARSRSRSRARRGRGRGRGGLAQQVARLAAQVQRLSRVSGPTGRSRSRSRSRTRRSSPVRGRSRNRIERDVRQVDSSSGSGVVGGGGGNSRTDHVALGPWTSLGNETAKRLKHVVSSCPGQAPDFKVNRKVWFIGVKILFDVPELGNDVRGRVRVLVVDKKDSSKAASDMENQPDHWFSDLSKLPRSKTATFPKEAFPPISGDGKTDGFPVVLVEMDLNKRDAGVADTVAVVKYRAEWVYSF